MSQILTSCFFNSGYYGSSLYQPSNNDLIEVSSTRPPASISRVEDLFPRPIRDDTSEMRNQEINKLRKLRQSVFQHLIGKINMPGKRSRQHRLRRMR